MLKSNEIDPNSFWKSGKIHIHIVPTWTHDEAKSRPKMEAACGAIFFWGHHLTSPRRPPGQDMLGFGFVVERRRYKKQCKKTSKGLSYNVEIAKLIQATVEKVLKSTTPNRPKMDPWRSHESTHMDAACGARFFWRHYLVSSGGPPGQDMLGFGFVVERRRYKKQRKETSKGLQKSVDKK